MLNMHSGLQRDILGYKGTLLAMEGQTGLQTLRATDGHKGLKINTLGYTDAR